MNAQYQQYVSTDGKFSLRQSPSKSEIYQLKREEIVGALFDKGFLELLL